MGFKFWISLSIILLLSGCWPTSPDQRWQLAAQGAYSAAIDPAGAHLVVGSLQHGGSFWSIADYARLYNWNHRQGFLTEILYSDFSSDGRFALTANYYNLVLWDTRTGQSVAFWEAPARIQAAALDNTGQFALLGLDNGQAVLFDVQNGGVFREYNHGGPVISVSVNTQAGLALTGSEDNTAALWSLRNGEVVRVFEYNNKVSLVALSGSGKLALMVPSNESAQLWDLSTRQMIAELSTAKYRLTTATFIGDQRLLTGTTHRDIFEFDASNGERIGRWRIGGEVSQSLRSTQVLAVGLRSGQLLAIGSNGYLYGF